MSSPGGPSGPAPEPRRPLQPRLVGWLTVPGRPGPLPVVVLEASAGECGLYLAERVGVGESVGLELAGGPAELRRPLALRVTDVRPAAGGGFEVGAAFVAPLDGKELQALLGGP
jgi:hypothetical protein